MMGVNAHFLASGKGDLFCLDISEEWLLWGGGEAY